MSELEKGSWDVEKVLTLINAQEVKNQQDTVVGFGNKEEGNIWIVVLFTMCIIIPLFQIITTVGMVSGQELCSKLRLSKEKMQLDNRRGLGNTFMEVVENKLLKQHQMSAMSSATDYSSNIKIKVSLGFGYVWMNEM